MDVMVKALDAKLQLLELKQSKNQEIVSKGNIETIERYRDNLKVLAKETDELKRKIEEGKVLNGDKLDEVVAWSSEVEMKLESVDTEVANVGKWLDEAKENATWTTMQSNQAQLAKERQQQLEFERAQLDLKLEFNKKTAELKLQQQGEGSDPKGEGSCSGIQAKLPKLVITKFDGSYQDWTRFWGQYCETIDKTTIASITKFAYLRELLCIKVRKSIEALPFTEDGYERAKNVLEDKFGKESEIVKAYVKEIMELSVISGVNIKKIHEFSDRLAYCVQSLETMGKIGQVNGYVSMTLDKLPGIRGDLVRTDEMWESWDFVKLCEALRLWTRRNPLDNQSKEKDFDAGKHRKDGSNKFFNARGREAKQGCVYCDDSAHKSGECTKITTLDERKQILAKNRLCFNCTRAGHRAAQCLNKGKCQRCERRHHTSICNEPVKDEVKKTTLTTCTSTKTGEGTFPVVMVKVDGVKCRALVDSGAGSSYASAKLIALLNKKPIDTTVKQVDMLMSTSLERMETYQTTVEAASGNFKMDVNLIKVNKGELLSLDNPRYQSLIAKYPHLEEVKMDDEDTKAHLPVHVVLGAGEYARMKTNCRPLVGQDGEPIAELTKFGWFIMSPGQEFNHNQMLMTQTSQQDYEELCRLDILGLADTPEHDQEAVYGEFREQLVRNAEGWYETGLPWRGDRQALPNNKQGSLQRLKQLTKKLQRKGMAVEYDNIITEQKNQGVVEPAEMQVKGVEFYIPHKPVVKEDSQTTKTRIVYDASSRAYPDAASLNECLYPGPSLQNKLWDVLVRQRIYPVALTGDLKKAFLQIRIKEAERDALRFHWRKNEHAEIETLRFTRALFGLASSPFLLGGVLECHLETWEHKWPISVAELRRNIYVDDLIGGGMTVEETQNHKDQSIEIFEDAGFELHKWSSNVPQLEGGVDEQDGDLTYAKQQLLQPADMQTSLLGLGWDKDKDELKIKLPLETGEPTKRGILRKLARIYDPLGLVSPLSLEGKLIYREACNEKQAWDTKVTEPLQRKWKKWEQILPVEEVVPRSVVVYQEPIESIELHSFGDASKQGVGAAVYSVVRQPSGTTQRLVVGKARLAKQGLSIPRLELIGAHMATNLVMNVKKALEGLPISRVCGWLDSTVVLYWLQGQGNYKQFVRHRVEKIQAQSEITWRHVGTSENPADLASRGGTVTKSTLWWNGPIWLANEENWPPNPANSASEASENEAAVIRQVLGMVHPKAPGDELDQLLEKHDLRRTLRICAWIRRFVDNCRATKKASGLLTTAEVVAVQQWWIKRVQQRSMEDPNHAQVQSSLNLQVNENGLLECRGRIQGRYQIYLPDDAMFTRKLVRSVHVETLHGGVGLTMAALRESYWVPRLRQLVKMEMKDCWGCKRFQVTALAAPPPGLLPNNRTEGDTAFETIGVDFAGPIRYRQSANREGKAYLALFACSLTRAVHLKLLRSLETEEFIPCLKRFIARRGRPRRFYSDNGGTFVKAEKWLRSVRQDEKLQGYLEKEEIHWQFNLSRAPWWGGQFERLISVVKRAFYKTIGAATLTWAELSEVILDVEIQINRRPLSYLEDDVQLPTLTPYSLLFQRSNVMPEQEPWREGDKGLRRRAKYLKSCKDAMWSRWSREYLTALRERHNLNHRRTKFEVTKGDVVLVKSEAKNRGKWPMGIVREIFPGRDGVLRAVRVETKNGFLERAVQHLYPLELSCDVIPISEEKELNVEAVPFRPKRDAAVVAAKNIKRIAGLEENTV